MPKLSNVWKAVGKTINLAQSQSYQVPRKPPLNSLVFEKLPDAKCVPGPKCDAAATKPLRLCSKEELKCMYCPPVPCDCKCVPPALTLKQRLGESAFQNTVTDYDILELPFLSHSLTCLLLHRLFSFTRNSLARI